MRAILALAALLLALPAAAQSTPEAAAREYVRAFQAGQWDQAAAVMHPDALAQLKGFFSTLAEADSSGQVLGPLLGVGRPAEFQQLTGAQIYTRLLGSLGRLSPQLTATMRGMQAEVIGSVAEGESDAHVVYRMRFTVDGVTTTKVQVLSVRRSGDRFSLALL